MATPAFPPDLVLDVHDLAAIILNCHFQLEPKFAKTKLLEINRGTSSLQTLPDHILAPQWDMPTPGQRRVAYILRDESSAPDRVTIDTFAHPDGVKTPTSNALTRRELEDVFWRCKDFDSGYILAYAAQQVFNTLPPTAKLRARTSTGHTITCAPSAVAVAEIDILPREACLMVVYEPQPHLGPTKVRMEQHLSGFGGSMPWVYLLIGEATAADLEQDTRVVFDLALPQIGGRGRGGEVFALERGKYYHDEVLKKYAEEFEDYKLSAKLQMSPSVIRGQGETLKKMVLERLARVVAGEESFYGSLCVQAMSDVQLPADACIDVHDLAAILLDCHSQLEDRFAKTTLVEITRDAVRSIEPFPEHYLDSIPEWNELYPGQRRVAYFVKNDSQSPSCVTLDTFAQPEGVTKPNGHVPTRRELEDIFWRCKTYDRGSTLAYVLQLILLILPASATLPNLNDTRVLLDLGLAQIGGRGRGEELSALERVQTYRQGVLDKYATEVTYETTYGLNPPPPEVGAYCVELTDIVLKRLAKNVTIDDFYGDPLTGNQFAYSPKGAWNIGQNCTICLAHPDPSREWLDTWHDSTAPGNATSSASVIFNGTALYVFGVVVHGGPQTQNGFIGASNLQFLVDNSVAGTFADSTPSPNKSVLYDYNVLLFQTTSLASGSHNFTLINEPSSLVLLDRAVYTTNEETSSSNSGTESTGSLAPTTSPATTSPPSASSASSSKHKVIIPVVVAVASVIVIASIAGAVYYSRRRRRQIPTDPINAFDADLLRPYTDDDTQTTEVRWPAQATAKHEDVEQAAPPAYDQVPSTSHDISHSFVQPEALLPSGVRAPAPTRLEGGSSIGMLEQQSSSAIDFPALSPAQRKLANEIRLEPPVQRSHIENSDDLGQ
ncbi:hypothetical protein CERSUDRAFT_90259 [Gelatoporia subvermispora B]|uniref:Uncharacterized protein n=1 Tax=Ceriporiopsis subvermispora (strain B) TaxID=914234 RepID=M2RTB1_CERS8|nr:hypothetical protein CERSUDRAFT_90259 [Gelatoporia subvermispora B]